MFDFGNHNYLRPKIEGVINGNICLLHFKPISLLKIWMYWAVASCLVIVPVVLLLNPFDIDFPGDNAFRILIGPMFFAFNYAVVLGQQNAKIASNFKYLTNIANGYW